MKILSTLIVTVFCAAKLFSQADIPEGSDKVKIYFDFGKWEIKDDKQLVRLIETARTNPDMYVFKLYGYTDTIGAEEFNRYLADFRMNSVADKLNSKGVFMITKTIVGETSRGKLGENRRVDVALIKMELAPTPADDPEPESQPEPVPAPEKMEVELDVPTNLGIEFQNNSDIIMNYSYKEVDYLFFAMLDHPDYDVELHGHVCCTDNYEISRMRAEAVKTALIQKGIDKARIKCFGHSNTQPLVPETDVESQQRNRRVEAVFKKK